jgi:hypothetical protein
MRTNKIVFIDADRDIEFERFLTAIDRIQRRASGAYLMVVTPAALYEPCRLLGEGSLRSHWVLR